MGAVGAAESVIIISPGWRLSPLFPLRMGYELNTISGATCRSGAGAATVALQAALLRF
jgi:hypothetical protein